MSAQTTVDRQSVTLLLNGRQMHVQIDGYGTPVVLIGGIGFDHHAWDMQVPTLVRAGARCIRYDLRDVGKSSRTTGDDAYGPSDLADDAVELVDRLELATFHLVGLSLGGAVAQELALRIPTRMLSLILITSWATSGERWKQRVADWELLLATERPEAHVRRLMTALFSDDLLDDSERARGLLDRLLNPPVRQEPDAFLRQLRCAARHDAGGRLDALPATLPTQVIAGECDALISPCASRRLADEIPGAELTVIDGAPHALNLERAGELNPILTRIVREHPG
jgi:pimeloyl-ACP methyl ester carboxylesterase